MVQTRLLAALAACLLLLLAATAARADTLDVTTAADTGAGSLRAALTTADGDDTIDFAIPAGETHAIALASALPAVGPHVRVAGETQTGDRVKIDGSGIADRTGIAGLDLDGAGASASGLDVTGTDLGVRVSGAEARVEDLTITDTLHGGIDVLAGGTGATLVDNRVEGAASDGAVVVRAGHVAVGTPGHGNHLSGSDEAWAVAVTDGAADVTIQGNLIEDGLLIDNSPGATIGGAATDAGNSFTTRHTDDADQVAELIVDGDGATGAKILGNQVGIVPDNFVQRPEGLVWTTAPGTQIGGAGPGEGNQLQGTSLGLDGGTATVYGNRIGDLVGPSDDVGVFVDSDGNTIGGTASGQANVIAKAGDDGVLVDSGRRNSIRGNDIQDNDGLGISLQDDPGTTPFLANDPLDVDAGSNDGQNFPVLQSAATSFDGTLVRGTLSSRPSSTYLVDVYSDVCDPSGYGEGAAWIGATRVTTDAKGNATFASKLSGGLGRGRDVTATATDASGNTSEFSKCIRAGALLGLQADETHVVPGTVTNLGLVRTSLSDVPAHVRIRSIDETAKAGRDYVKVDRVVTFKPGQQWINVPISGIFIKGLNETRSFRVELSEPSDSLVLGRSSERIRVFHEDPGPPVDMHPTSETTTAAIRYGTHHLDIRGTARAPAFALRSVGVSIHKVGAGKHPVCRRLGAGGRLEAHATRASCTADWWLKAKGTNAWKLTNLARGLTAGRYTVRTRARATISWLVERPASIEAQSRTVTVKKPKPKRPKPKPKPKPKKR